MNTAIDPLITPALALPVPGMRWGGHPERAKPPGGRQWRRGLHGPHGPRGPLAFQNGAPCHPEPRPCCR
jgi:hypothetical protein